jgi:hypothetical protein
MKVMSALPTDLKSTNIKIDPLSNVDSNYSDANQYNDYSGNF